MIRAAIVAGLLAVAAPAMAAEHGCEKLAWRLDAERSLLGKAADGPPSIDPPQAHRLRLGTTTALPKAPGRAARGGDGHAGFATISVPAAGLYRVTMDAEGWVDVIQRDAYVAADAFAGVRGCPGIRKSVRFRLEAGPALVQISGSSGESVAFVVTPVPEAER